MFINRLKKLCSPLFIYIKNAKDKLKVKQANTQLFKVKLYYIYIKRSVTWNYFT